MWHIRHMTFCPYEYKSERKKERIQDGDADEKWEYKFKMLFTLCTRWTNVCVWLAWSQLNYVLNMCVNCYVLCKSLSRMANQ